MSANIGSSKACTGSAAEGQVAFVGFGLLKVAAATHEFSGGSTINLHDMFGALPPLCRIIMMASAMEFAHGRRHPAI